MSCIDISLSICMYIYIYREREREHETAPNLRHKVSVLQDQASDNPSARGGHCLSK